MSLITTAALQQELASIGATLRDATVVVRTRSRGRRSPSGQGSGIVWTPDGAVVTNAHVATADALRVELADGRAFDASVTLRDRRRDLANLQIDRDALGATALPLAPVGDPTTLRPGHLVVALGHPLGVPNSMAVGVVHTIGRASWQGGTVGSPALIHSDIRLAPGNSGGPLADASGRIVGVNAMIAGGLGVAVSVEEVRRLLLAGTPRPQLGATLRPVTVRAATLTQLGLLVLETSTRGAADRAGILPGDVLLGHAGRPFRHADDVAALLHDAGAGATLRLDVGRAGRRISVEIELGLATRRAA